TMPSSMFFSGPHRGSPYEYLMMYWYSHKANEGRSSTAPSVMKGKTGGRYEEQSRYPRPPPPSCSTRDPTVPAAGLACGAQHGTAAPCQRVRYRCCHFGLSCVDAPSEDPTRGRR